MWLPVSNSKQPPPSTTTFTKANMTTTSIHSNEHDKENQILKPNGNGNQIIKQFYVDSLYSVSHIQPGTEELLLPVKPTATHILKPAFTIPTALINNQYLQQNPMLQQASLRSLTGDAAAAGHGTTDTFHQQQHQLPPQQMMFQQSMTQFQESMMLNGSNTVPNGMQQPPALAIPPFNPANFHSVPMNRHLQVVEQREPPKRSRTTGSSRVLSTFAPPGVELYEATYSNIDVYELIANGAELMRRRDDGWVNATHILKVAGVEKGRRTKILDREVPLSKYEKVQGGYGKYQGTWVPLEDAKNVAQQFGVFDLCSPILNLP